MTQHQKCIIFSCLTGIFQAKLPVMSWDKCCYSLVQVQADDIRGCKYCNQIKELIHGMWGKKRAKWGTRTLYQMLPSLSHKNSRKESFCNYTCSLVYHGMPVWEKLQMHECFLFIPSWTTFLCFLCPFSSSLLFLWNRFQGRMNCFPCPFILNDPLLREKIWV